MPAVEEITAIYCCERHRWPGIGDAPDTVVIECAPVNGDANPFGMRGRFEVKTTAELDELKPFGTYRFYGTKAVYTNKRTRQEVPQFHAKTWIQTQPHGEAGTVRYLMQAPHVGAKVAATLWAKFQGEAVRILREEPDVAAAAAGVAGFTPARATEAATYLREQQALEDCSIDLIDLLSGRGFPKVTQKKATKLWGNQAAAKIRQIPYRLMRFRGCGFLKVDQLYMKLWEETQSRRYRPDWIGRQIACAWYVLARTTAEEGHTWHPRQTVVQQLPRMIGTGREINPPLAVRLGVKHHLLDVRRDNAGAVQWICDARHALNEAYIAERIAVMMRTPGQWPDTGSLDVSDHQRDELAKAMGFLAAILTGSPGTGKTYTAARVIAALGELHGLDKIAVCAPTGKAACRITESLAAYGIAKQATTIHSLLGRPQEVEGDGWSFAHCEDNPLPYWFVVVDESSMIDLPLFASLLRALAPGCHLLLLGDVGQLPPVGPGAPLRDLIAAGVPTGRLSKIERNDGTIVRACMAIRDGRRFEVDQVLDPPAGRNIGLLATRTAAESIDRIVSVLKSIRDRSLCDPVWDCQVIVALNKTGELNRRTLNRLLQQELNPHGETAAGSPFRVGDKIVCLKNGLLPLSDAAPRELDDGEEVDAAFVANGEIGEVLAVAEKSTIAKFDGPERIVRIPRGKGKEDDEADGSADGEKSDTGCQFDLGYAISCHKSQGSEWPVVLVALDDYSGARRVCSREWLYTAISRAKQVCYLVGQKPVADSMCLRQSLTRRKTFLTESIQEALCP